MRSNWTENRRIPFRPALELRGESSEGGGNERDRRPRAEIDEPMDRNEQIRINRELEAEVGFKSRVLKSRNVGGSKRDPRRANIDGAGANVSNSRFLAGYSTVELERPLSPVWNHGISYPENRNKPITNEARGVKISAEDREEDIR